MRKTQKNKANKKLQIALLTGKKSLVEVKKNEQEGFIYYNTDSKTIRGFGCMLNTKGWQDLDLPSLEVIKKESI
jgi:hypothetical protein